MLTLITCTGGRPEAFRLCERYIGAQSYTGDLQWIVVDDYEVPTITRMGQTVLRPEPFWSGKATLDRNLLAALPLVKGDKVLFIEDDDWYGPEYLSIMDAELNSASLVGDIPARYYNVSTWQYRELQNRAHASLAQTGMRVELIPSFTEICQLGGKFLDLPLFRKYKGVPSFIESRQHVGIKGMPGRAGIGMGHHPHEGWSKDDQSGEKLSEWIGADSWNYRTLKANAA